MIYTTIFCAYISFQYLTCVSKSIRAFALYKQVSKQAVNPYGFVIIAFFEAVEERAYVNTRHRVLQCLSLFIGSWTCIVALGAGLCINGWRPLNFDRVIFSRDITRLKKNHRSLSLVPFASVLRNKLSGTSIFVNSGPKCKFLL